jgi:carbonic anhydrase
MRAARPVLDSVVDGAAAVNRRSVLRLGALMGGGMLVGSGALLAGCGSDKESGDKAGDKAGEKADDKAPAATRIAEGVKPEGALAELKAGNARFVGGKPIHPDQSAKRRTELAGGQHPFALVLSCIDSRVPPELVFDQGLGNLMVSRTAGQVLDDAVQGSLEYGVLELEIPLLVVLGHEKCGAVKATLEAVEKKSPPFGNDLDALIAAIKPAVEKAEKEHAADPLDAAIRYNVANIVAQLRQDAALAPALSGGKLRIVGARYDLDTGSVSFT